MVEIDLKIKNIKIFRSTPKGAGGRAGGRSHRKHPCSQGHAFFKKRRALGTRMHGKLHYGVCAEAQNNNTREFMIYE